MLTKIRFLLFVLTLSLMGTALTIHFTISAEDMLALDEQRLSQKIHDYEDRIDEIWTDSLVIKTFQHANQYPVQLANLTKAYKKEFIYFYVYSDNQIIHWSTNIYVPYTDVGLRHNTTVIQTENRTFLAKKKELTNGVSVLALVPIKRNFSHTNQYLENNFLSSIGVNNIDIAQYDDDKNIRNIYSKMGNYLFSVKLMDGKKDNIYINLQFFCWVSALICLLILSNSIAVHWAKKGKPWLGMLLFFSVLWAVRYIDLKSNWLSMNSSLELFDPKYYAYNTYLPNIWSFLASTVCVCWFMCYLLVIQKYIQTPKYLYKKSFSVIVSIAGLLSIYFIGQLIYYFLGTLITHSPIYQNDFTKVLDLGFYGWICVLLFCINSLSLILYIDRMIQVVKSLLKNLTTILNVELFCLVCALIVTPLLGLHILFAILFGIIIFIRTYKMFHISSPYQLSTFILSTLVFSMISAVSYNHYNQTRDAGRMEQAIAGLLAEDDANAVSLFADLEKSMTEDYRLSKLFSLSRNSQDIAFINEYVKTRYMSGYLSRFEFQSFYYDNTGKALENYAENIPKKYREDVLQGAIKIPFTSNFYRLHSELGTREYFTHISIPDVDNPEIFHHLYLSLKNLSYSSSLPYPEVLADYNTTGWQFGNVEKNSYALYKNDILVRQFGPYNYTDNNFNITSKLQTYLPLPETSDYYHLAYRPDKYTTLIYSSPKAGLWEYVALASINFVILLLFFGLFNLASYLIITFSNTSFRWNRTFYYFRTLFKNIQYSTRIQALVSASVLLGTLISGAVAFIGLNRQFEETTTRNRLREIADITKKIENYVVDTHSQQEFNRKVIEILKQMAPSSMMNFNLYDKKGKLLYSSQQRIFDLKLSSTFMHPGALNELAVLRKSEAYEHERISNFWYSSAYAPIKNEDYTTAAYLNIPYYTTEQEAANNKNLLLNTILNIYAFIIIIFGFIAVTVSRKITKPLDIVRMKLADTQLSNAFNEPLYWDRNDEIGLLIKEYNHMLIKLENSAKQLRDAERESAWREMAKQVAHEIKNPLTPMKLGIQQLMRSYQENDSRFEERFQRISHSIIEQIDVLTKIATEFSAFAKLPETNLEKIHLPKKIQKSINLFANAQHTSITFDNETGQKDVYVMGDRDQFLRMFNNLLKNAIEASLGRKRIQIHILMETLDTDVVRILVQDNGFGIPEEAIPKIFKPNFTTKSSGTGLGLAFVKQTVTGVGGKIEFNTRPNKGTTFIITLPVLTNEA